MQNIFMFVSRVPLCCLYEWRNKNQIFTTLTCIFTMSGVLY